MQHEIFYRYEDPYLVDGLCPWLDGYGELREFRFSLVAETPKGYWITNYKGDDFYRFVSHYLDKPKWVSATARKRFAYPTKELALESYMMRKKRQIKILKNKLQRAETGLSRAKQLSEEKS